MPPSDRDRWDNYIIQRLDDLGRDVREVQEWIEIVKPHVNALTGLLQDAERGRDIRMRAAERRAKWVQYVQIVAPVFAVLIATLAVIYTR